MACWRAWRRVHHIKRRSRNLDYRSKCMSQPDRQDVASSCRLPRGRGLMPSPALMGATKEGVIAGAALGSSAVATHSGVRPPPAPTPPPPTPPHIPRVTSHEGQTGAIGRLERKKPFHAAHARSGGWANRPGREKSKARKKKSLPPSSDDVPETRR